MQVNLVRVIDPLKIMNVQHTQTSILRFLVVLKQLLIVVFNSKEMYCRV